jgi:hypothetical protein
VPPDILDEPMTIEFDAEIVQDPPIVHAVVLIVTVGDVQVMGPLPPADAKTNVEVPAVVGRLKL